MTDLDRPWARKRLITFLEVATIRYVPDAPNSVGFWRYVLVNGKEKVQAEAQIVEHILDRVVPNWRNADWPEPKRQPYWRHREASTRAIAQLESEEELAERLGEIGPTARGSDLHAWVWGAASTFWQSGHYAAAVEAAGKSINAHAQSKLGRRDLSEWKLISAAFNSSRPPAGDRRLRLLGVPEDSASFNAIHEGVGFLARGLYQAVRNPAAHNLVELEEIEAVEQLAAFSLLARFVDAAVIEAHDGG